MATRTLPSDIITDILSRLPSKTLIRFKSVSKQWYSLINSSNFINLHLSKTLISQNLPNLIISQFSISSAAIPNENNPNLHLIELDHPLKHLCKTHNFSSYDREQMPQILGSINGVLCISMYDKSSVVLYNPSTKTHRFIPPFTPSPDTNPYSKTNPVGTTINFVVFGFGFDSVSGDYKLLRMINTLKNSVVVCGEPCVYSLRDDSWKCVNDQTMMGEFFLRNHMGVFVNGVLHFIGVDSELYPKIKCFNIRTETFVIFDLPMFDKRSIRDAYDIHELGGCLSLIVNRRKIDLAGPISPLLRADLWVMKEYGNKESWFRLFSIRDPARLEVLTYVRPVVYSRDKERVLLELDDFSFGWYSWGSKSLERITVHGRPASAPCETWTFVDSLVSIQMDKDRSKPKVVPKKKKNKIDRDGFLSSGFKLRL